VSSSQQHLLEQRMQQNESNDSSSTSTCTDLNLNEEGFSNENNTIANKASSASIKNTKSQICKLYATVNGCRNGQHCQFKHVPNNNQNKDTTATTATTQNHLNSGNTHSQKSQSQICKFFLQNRCRNGSNCKLLHDNVHHNKRTHAQFGGMTNNNNKNDNNSNSNNTTSTTATATATAVNVNQTQTQTRISANMNINMMNNLTSDLIAIVSQNKVL
jgi:hypothetical protein